MIGSNILSEYDSKNLLKNINKIFNKKLIGKVLTAMEKLHQKFIKF